MEGCDHVVRVGDAWCSLDAGRVPGRWPVKVGSVLTRDCWLCHYILLLF